MTRYGSANFWGALSPGATFQLQTTGSGPANERPLAACAKEALNFALLVLRQPNLSMVRSR
jgi:hypothetical protein